MWWIVRTRRRSRGTILVAAIVCMVVAMMMVGAVVNGLMIQQRESRVDHQRLQSLWLAESARPRRRRVGRGRVLFRGNLAGVRPHGRGPGRRERGNCRSSCRGPVRRRRGTDPGPLAPQYVDPRQLPPTACHPASRAGRCFMNSPLNSRIADAEGQRTRFVGFPTTVPVLPAILPPSRWSSCWS